MPQFIYQGRRYNTEKSIKVFTDPERGDFYLTPRTKDPFWVRRGKFELVKDLGLALALAETQGKRHLIEQHIKPAPKGKEDELRDIAEELARIGARVAQLAAKISDLEGK